MLLLPPSSATAKEVLGSISAPWTKEVECAGSAFMTEAWVDCARDAVRDPAEVAASSKAAAAVAAAAAGGGSSGSAHGAEAAAPAVPLADIDPENYYELLGLGAERYNATQKSIKIAYHKRLLELHPDKQAVTEEDEADPVFLAIQKAYGVLSDKEKKRGYDSHFEFDDAIPGDLWNKSGKRDFFKVFGPVFESNARFSEKQPVPMLGGDGAAEEEVTAFYAFWHRFDSWRDFSMQDEHNLEEAEDRWEKREMQRENKAARAKKKKKEIQRVADLVTRAERCDPRVARFRKAAAEAKQKAREEKEAARQAEAAAKAEAEAAEKKAKEEEAAKAKGDKDAAKAAKAKAAKALRKAKKAFKALVAPDAINPLQLAELCSDLDLEKLSALVAEIEAGGGAGSEAATTVPQAAAAKYLS